MLMSKIESNGSLKEVSGRRLSLLGPFLFLDLSEEPELFERIPVDSDGMDMIGKNGNDTFPCMVKLLKSEGMDLIHEGERFVLPQKALVIVFPDTQRVWIPKEPVVGNSVNSSSSDLQVVSGA